MLSRLNDMLAASCTLDLESVLHTMQDFACSEGYKAEQINKMFSYGIGAYASRLGSMEYMYRRQRRDAYEQTFACSDRCPHEVERSFSALF